MPRSVAVEISPIKPMRVVSICEKQRDTPERTKVDDCLSHARLSKSELVDLLAADKSGAPDDLHEEIEIHKDECHCANTESINNSIMNTMVTPDKKRDVYIMDIRVVVPKINYW